MYRFNEKRLELIKEVASLGSLWRADAESCAFGAVRNAGNKEAMIRASVALAKSDAAETAANEAIKLINRHWPHPADAEKGE